MAENTPGQREMSFGDSAHYKRGEYASPEMMTHQHHSARKQSGRLSHEQIELLVVQATKGSQDAFATLYEAYLPQIFFYARKRLKSDDETIEVVQDTFLAALMKLDCLRNPRAFHSWIYSIAGAYIASAQRRSSQRALHEQSLDALTERVQVAVENDNVHPVAEVLTSTDTDTDPQSALDVKEQRLALISAIDALSDAQKEAVLLRYYAGLSVAEYAAAAGLSQSAALKRLHDARIKLRATLKVSEESLTSALCDAEQTRALDPITGLGAQATLGIVGALSSVDLEQNFALALSEKGLQQLAAKAAAARPASSDALAQQPQEAPPESSTHRGLPLALKIIVAALVLILLATGGYALYRAKTSKIAPEAPPAQTTGMLGQKPQGGQSTAPETTGTAATTQPATEEPAEPNVQQRSTSQGQPGGVQQNAATSPQPAPTPVPAPQPAPTPAPAPARQRPTLTVQTATLSYGLGTPVGPAALIAASGASAYSPDDGELTVVLEGYANINWSHAGSYLCYLTAKDSVGLGAVTQVLTVIVQ